MRALGGLLVVCWSWHAVAADPLETDVLFDEGRTLLEAGQPAEACAKFEASLRLEPQGLGTILNVRAISSTTRAAIRSGSGRRAPGA